MMSACIDLREDARAAAPALDYDEALAEAARLTWRGRMVNEHMSATVFEGLAEQLAELGFDAQLVSACHGFAAEERRHGVLCGAVVEALGGAALAPLPHREDFPRHHDVPALEGLLRNIISICCLSETVAVALIGAERLEMPDGPLRELLTGIYADEIGHARFGWQLVGRIVPGLDAAVRERLSRYLVLALSHLEAHELAHIPEGAGAPAGGERLGLCSGADARRLLYDTIDGVILPGLEAAGLDARRAWNAAQAR